MSRTEDWLSQLPSISASRSMDEAAAQEPPDIALSAKGLMQNSVDIVGPLFFFLEK